MLPSRMVVVRTYDPGNFVVGAERDLEVLRVAGLDAHLKPAGRHGEGPGWAALYVAENGLEEARRLLEEAEPSAGPTDAPGGAGGDRLRCPRCGGTDVRACAPYALLPVLLGIAGGLWAGTQGQAGTGGLLVVTGGVAGYVVKRRYAPWRCGGCAHRFGEGSG